ncbi:TerB family tellurite resistance protein [Muricauda sp. 2012CJ35-5]|uniref:TerB family tellurite resistance protein n=1 Tax=Flagellimonas spongiicola TaxID=2942208 RepID=A0ABT0PT80_9FLAO|nr:TerB family tellurite resistance protein [Allomuricauda spongiicola]MCL6274593.1 TerB family tellurite resistance protein [Allomuricauda spongiicola]
MPILDLYEHSEQKRNLAHFATLASLAAADGIITDDEKAVLDKFAFRLNISDADYKEVMKKENKYPIETPHSSERRLMRLFDFFGMALADKNLDDAQKEMIVKYAVGLGYSPENAEKLVNKSIAIFTGKIDFEDYMFLMEK